MPRTKGKTFVFSATIIVSKRIEVEAYDHDIARQKARAAGAKIDREEWVDALDGALAARGGEPEIDWEETLS